MRILLYYEIFFNLLIITFCSSEVHEKMCCNRCRQPEMMSDTGVASECMNEGCQIDEEDIGGFAAIAGCLEILKSHEKQVSEVQNIQILRSDRVLLLKCCFMKVGTPKEEDLANWGHHHSPSSVPDLIFQASAGDEVRISSEAVSASVLFC